MNEFSLLTYLGGSVIALFVGFLTGIFGVGGGFLITPALMILLGIPGPIAVGTGLAVMLANSSWGIIKRRNTGTIDVKLALSLASGSVIGVLIGVFFMKLLKKMHPLVILGKEQNAVQYILLWLFLFLLICIIGVLVFDLNLKNRQGSERRIGLLSRMKIPPYVRLSSLDEPEFSLTILAGLGLSVGILTGLLGVGGGVIILPALVYLVGQRTVKAAGTSLLLVWISSLFGVVMHATEGNVNLYLLGTMLVGGLLGTNFGTIVGLKLAGVKIRYYFIWVVILAVIMIGMKIGILTFS
ncbi:MAG: sulfite exporter TauE/SafE family protein [Phycisphaerales bacterium]